MWLERVVAQLTDDDAPAVILEGSEELGTPFLVEALQRRARVAWLELEASDAGDPVALGNRIAAAVNDAFRANVLQGALPWEYQLTYLKQQLASLPALTLVVGRAHHAPELVRALCGFARPRCRVVLETPAELAAGCRGARRIDTEQLQLTLAEATELAPRGVADDEIRRCYKRTNGAYTAFLAAVHAHAGLPALQLPGPTGPRLSRGDGRLFEPRRVLRALVRAQDWEAALELAALRVPEAIESVVADAGPAMQEAGRLRRLHLVLSALDAAYQRSETVLEWRLVAAVAAGEQQAVLPDVEAHLAAFEAPALRARYAALRYPEAAAFEEARRAARMRETPLTLFQLGRLHPDPDEGADTLMRAVELAEARGSAYEVARNAGALAEQYNHLGRYREAVHWSEWALRVFDDADLRDGQRRLRLLNSWAVARILSGDTAGLRRVLQDTQAALEHTLPSHALAFRSTLSWLETAEGQLERALELAMASLHDAPRRYQGRYAVFAVRLLLELERFEAAAEVGRRALHLTRDGADYFSGMGRLAHAMSLARPAEGRAPAGDPAGGVGGGDGPASAVLAGVAADLRLPMELRCVAALYALLRGEATLAHLPPEVGVALRGLAPTGLYLLSGSERWFEGVWDGIGGSEARLKLRLLGRPRATLDGDELRLTVQQWEVVAALALHPDGLGVEALHAFLFRDESGTTLDGVRMRVHRLRKLLPISEPPYRLELAFHCDAATLQQHLREGRVRQALLLYQGELLPGHSGVGVAALREQLAEQVRQAALAARDAEVLFELAEVAGDDLELWQACLAQLHANDPRLALVRARVRSLAQEYGVDPARALRPEEGGR